MTIADPRALPTNQIVFTSREARTLAMQLYNELSVEGPTKDITSRTDPDVIQSRIYFGGHNPWRWLVVQASREDLEKTINQILLSNLAIAIFYDPEDRSNVVAISVICKNDVDPDKIFSRSKDK